MNAGIVSEPHGAAAQHARCAGRADLATLLQDTRARTLRLLDAYEAALGPALRVPQADGLNPPLWELGHIGWFADRWIARNPQRARGTEADPNALLLAARQAARGVDADALYDSSAVPHGARWHLPLPELATTRADLQAQLDDTLALLAHSALTDNTDNGLYFFRLALFHEAMHAEAWVYMAQALGIDVGEAAPPSDEPHGEALHLPAGEWTLGWQGPGFAFDNELQSEVVATGAFDIDAQAVHWARYLPAVRAGAVPLPRHLRHQDGQWQQRVHGQWRALDPLAPASHLSLHEAQAWCAWAGRRLPTEAEWEYAAHHAEGFSWGQVWEWTASAFAPLPGFTPHPYRDYSQPWFDGRPVLKGACHATAACMRHPRYRNFFTADRTDIFAGFRSVGRVI
jgi:EgtB-related family protein